MLGKSATIPFRDKVMIFLILAVVLGGLAFATYRQPSHVASAEAPRIFAGLPVDPVEANAAFRSRVLADFPLLSPEAGLVQTLSSQGFSSDGWFGKRMTFRRQHAGFRGCDFTASVSWDSDNQSRISAIDARLLRSPECT
jgi:hypothetical protein